MRRSKAGSPVSMGKSHTPSRLPPHQVGFGSRPREYTVGLVTPSTKTRPRQPGKRSVSWTAMSVAAAFQSVPRLLAPQVAAPWGSFWLGGWWWYDV